MVHVNCGCGAATFEARTEEDIPKMLSDAFAHIKTTGHTMDLKGLLRAREKRTEEVAADNRLPGDRWFSE